MGIPASITAIHADQCGMPTEGKKRRCITISHSAIPATLVARLNETGVYLYVPTYNIIMLDVSSHIYKAVKLRVKCAN